MNKYVFKKFTKKSGTLIPFSLKTDIPFKAKRIFLIYGNKDFMRGDHAHFKCKQFLIFCFGTSSSFLIKQRIPKSVFVTKSMIFTVYKSINGQ